jgi:tetratricopeptide (TPR) repeat protein
VRRSRNSSRIAGLDELAIEWWGKAGDQALRRSAFQEAIAHLGKAIAMADKAEAAASPHGARDAAAASLRLKLQTDYGQAVMYAKGFAAEETKLAFARATELAAKSDNFSERFAVAHGHWTLALVHGETKSARELASAFLQEAERLGRLVEVGVASRGLAIISYSLGEFAEARIHCERALAACDPQRDREARERFTEDSGVTAMSWLAVTMWQLGEVDRARELIAAELGHTPSMAHPLQAKYVLEFLRGDAAAALAAAEALEVLGREHGMPHWRATAQMRVVSARCRLYNPADGAAEFQHPIAALAEQGIGGGWFSEALLAERELRTRNVDSALARINQRVGARPPRRKSFRSPIRPPPAWRNLARARPG